MNKTLHKKLTEKHLFEPAHAIAFPKHEDNLPGYSYEMAVLRKAAEDLLQPRPEAIANLLKMVKEI